MFKKADTQFVIEIDPTKKYFVHIPGNYTRKESDDIAHALNEWMKGDEPFFLMFGDQPTIKLVKILSK